MTTLELQMLFKQPSYLANTAGSFARLELEPLVDTGNAVPIGIALQAPPSQAFQSFAVFAPDNPVSRCLQLTLGAPQSSYRFEVRIRLGASQDVWLVARLTDGSVMGMFQPTVLTSSACFDAS
ncbi:MAG: thiosulfate oxidation carrier protein SoxY [Cytophagales bacterium]|nr:thiosulfate oxidation carrier protein SoxY [Cytophagales bacterium]